MRKFGFHNVLGNQSSQSKTPAASGIDDNPTPEQQIIHVQKRKYSAYRTILTKHNELSAKLQDQPRAIVTDQPMECEDETPKSS